MKNNIWTITKYIIKLLQEDEQTCSKVKIMKILYFAKGHYYQEKHKALFDDCFEAWINGPVVREIYRILTYGYHWSYTSTSVDDSEVSDLSEEIKEFLKRVVSFYGEYNDATLIEASHEEEPWKKARVGLEDYDSATVKIDENDIKNYYQNHGRSIP